MRTVLMLMTMLSISAFAQAQSYSERREQALRQREANELAFARSQVPALENRVYQRLVKVASRNGGLVSYHLKMTARPYQVDTDQIELTMGNGFVCRGKHSLFVCSAANGACQPGNDLGFIAECISNDGHEWFVYANGSKKLFR